MPNSSVRFGSVNLKNTKSPLFLGEIAKVIKLSKKKILAQKQSFVCVLVMSVRGASVQTHWCIPLRVCWKGLIANTL